MNRHELLQKAFECSHCDNARLPFVRDLTGRSYRFPPTIGAVGAAPLLFVGINPRISESNRQLHESISSNSEAFVELSGNRFRGRRYIAEAGLEGHYRMHVTVAAELFPGREFEEVAAVTELHLCASETSVGIPRSAMRCLDRFFQSVLDQVQPSVIFAVGQHVLASLRGATTSENRQPTDSSKTAAWTVVSLPHPNAFGPRNELIARAISEARTHLNRRLGRT